MVNTRGALLLAYAFSTVAAAPWLPGADPSTSWLSYAIFEAGAIITAMSATVTVPADPAMVGADPSFWFGLQTADGDGALVQPILAWGQSFGRLNGGYSIFQEVYDWNNGRDYRSPETYAVPAGDTLYQSVSYVAANNSYEMLIVSNATGAEIRWSFALDAAQTAPETTACVAAEPRLPSGAVIRFVVARRQLLTSHRVISPGTSWWSTRRRGAAASCQRAAASHSPTSTSRYR